MKKPFNFTYLKTWGFVIAIVLAYFVFSNPTVEKFVSSLEISKLNYLGIFIAGMLFSFGFTAPFAAGFFITLNPGDVWLAGIIGGIGAMTSDLLIFKFIRISFENEFRRLKKGKMSRMFNNAITKTFGNKVKIYLMYVFAGILIASPLPDEAGVIMLAGLTKIKTNTLAIIGFILNTIGILILLNI